LSIIDRSRPSVCQLECVAHIDESKECGACTARLEAIGGRLEGAFSLAPRRADLAFHRSLKVQAFAPISVGLRDQPSELGPDQLAGEAVISGGVGAVVRSAAIRIKPDGRLLGVALDED
jgi:hypothetical protein